MTDKVENSDKIEESVASDTLKPQNKSQMLSAALAKMAGLSIEDLSHYLNDTLAQVGTEGKAIPDGASSKNQATLNMKESVKEDLSIILGEGEELSEEIKEQTSVLFESALEARLVIEREEILEETNKLLDEAYETMQQELAEKLDAYLDATIDNWLEENRVAIESSLRAELVENFISSMHTLFSEHNIIVPEAQVDVVEELTDRVISLEASLDEAIVERNTLKNELLESKAKDIIDEVCEGLAMTKAEKVRSLCENVEFNGDLEDFTRKVNIIKEGVVDNKSPTPPATGLLIEESDPNANSDVKQPVIDPVMERYRSAISRNLRK